MVGNRGRRSSGEKAVKRRAGNNFSSVFVGEVLDSLIEAKKGKISKNPRTVEKWLSKMRTSILKKVSLSSKIIFADRVDYATEFKNKQKEIGVLKAKVLENVQVLLKQRLSLKEPSLENIPSHGFSEKVASMGKKIGHMSHQLDSLSKDLQARVQSFGSTIAVVESAIKEKGKSGPVYPSRAAVPSSKATATANFDSSASAAAMMGDHLNQY